ncbi:aminotransferase class III-fold pyridoxal phosphate-dependent enzyme [Streptomyces sp. TRM70350]|uniref:aminotransferase class III-fold pyridoxal phosphate-dependent enzyme n=1 Tax=Streptomyces sp. TRM70350 TaxID=2856165 RepID=UPI001C45F932|nr:aminotransferase class III-fold pyridoxal phosphate-dependent enzyme [Streptomyces sp. TRM70350]MBV7699503.1 aminotransferase class III-fold pyridoxal phosphate-dependent enzyme [Streptomyces sp. TRM70350]
MAVTEQIPRRQPAREPGARTYPGALPIVPVRARGLTVEDADGRRYLDCLSGAGTLALGHNHPVVLEAIRKVLDSGAPLNVPDLATPVEDAFVTELKRTLPPGLAENARVQFCGPSATEAVETATALVCAATGRTQVVALTSTDHGMTPDLSGTSGEAGQAPDARLRSPRGCHCPFGIAGTDAAELAARRTGATLSSSSPATSPAGMLLEPVHGECGVIPTPDAWMRATRQITAARSIPLIVDETQTGVGRTGAFWAVEHSGVTPDVMILSETIGGSLPLAAVIHRDDLAPRYPITPTSPFRGNQLALAAGTATLAHVRQHRLAERAAAIGSHMLSQLRCLAREFPFIGDVRGRGLMIGVELRVASEAADSCVVRDEAGTPRISGAIGPTPPSPGGRAQGTHPAAVELAVAVQRECLRRGLIVGLARRHPSVVRLLPPLTINDEQASAVLDRLADALTAAARAHPDEGDRPSRRSKHQPHDHANHADRAERSR